MSMGFPIPSLERDKAAVPKEQPEQLIQDASSNGGVFFICDP